MDPFIPLAAVARLPSPDDNLAIATKHLSEGAEIAFGQMRLRLPWSVLEGHRFAVASISAGSELRSWGLPFGRAIEPIAPGDYVCNQAMLDELVTRRIGFDLPKKPNFIDILESYRFDESQFTTKCQVSGEPLAHTFDGYLRQGNRGVGTRNFIVVMGTSSRSSGFVKALAARFKSLHPPGIDGVVPLAHTEGGGYQRPNNSEHVLRTLAGFFVHPNVGAILAVDYGTEAINNAALKAYMLQHSYPMNDVIHDFLSIEGGFDEHVKKGAGKIESWLHEVKAERTPQSLSHLRVALQCGGSDAFSGISGNPLAAWSAREIIRAGGSANLAETDELIGAEHYVLQNVRDKSTARRFLGMVERFKERIAWHGESCEGNPSGGNKFRGLYNIAIKSIGAAMKKHPDVRLDYCIDYSEPMGSGGYYFMDSPGNDLESIAGQVAAGCNIIYFVTGNGSITNFPFVPTIKIVTTTPRFKLLEADMDVNAGAYQDGTSMDELGAGLFDLTTAIAGGILSKGEEAGHSQLQIWRNWQQRDGSQLEVLSRLPVPTGPSIKVRDESPPEHHFTAISGERGLTSDQVGLILPTSLCSGQVAQAIADRLNTFHKDRRFGVSRFVALVHTEGCGVTGAEAQAVYTRSMLNYLTHPLVHSAVLLEHGCEKTHNDFMRHSLLARGLDGDNFGWASVQSDGGIDQVCSKVEGWFRSTLEGRPLTTTEAGTWPDLRVGIMASGTLSQSAARAFAQLTRWLISGGATVVLTEGGALLESMVYVEETFPGGRPEANLAHGAGFSSAGCFIVETPTQDWTEALTGMGAAGVEIIVAHVRDQPMQGHPLVPLLQASDDPITHRRYGADIDLELTGPPADWTRILVDSLLAVASRRYQVKAMGLQNTGFQLTRGRLGVSM